MFPPVTTNIITNIDNKEFQLYAENIMRITQARALNNNKI